MKQCACVCVWWGGFNRLEDVRAMGFEECIGVYHLNSAMKEIESSV